MSDSVMENIFKRREEKKKGKFLGSRYPLVITLFKKKTFSLCFCPELYIISSSPTHPPKKERVTSRAHSSLRDVGPAIRMDKVDDYAPSGDVSIYHRGRDKCCSRVEFLLSIFLCRLPISLRTRTSVVRGRPRRTT